MPLGQSDVRGDHLPSRSSAHHGCADLLGRKPSCSLRTSGPCWKRKAIYKQRGTAAAWTDRTEPNCGRQICSSVPWQVSFKSNRLSSKNRCDNKHAQICQLRVKRILRRHLQSRRARIPWIGKLKSPGIPEIQIQNTCLCVTLVVHILPIRTACFLPISTDRVKWPFDARIYRRLSNKTAPGKEKLMFACPPSETNRPSKTQLWCRHEKTYFPQKLASGSGVTSSV